MTRTIGVIRSFHCDQCHEGKKVYLGEHDTPPTCCGQVMTALVEGRPTKTSIFPFTTTHVDGLGNPIAVESLHHLRALERQYGVVFSAFSNSERHVDAIQDLPRHRVGGREYEG